MSTPAPIIDPTILIIKSTKNIEYSFEISLKNSKIEIIIESINEIPKAIYMNNYSLEQLFTLNKYFKLCEKIEEAYQVIIDNLESKKLEIKESINTLSFII